MKYIDCLVMNAGLHDVKVSGMKADFSYAVAMNKRLLEPVIKSLEEMVEPTKEHEKFITERKELLQEFAKKDENGDPIVRGSVVAGQQKETYLIPGISNKNNEFNVKLEKLKKKFKKEIDDQEAKEKEYDEHLDEETLKFEPIMVARKLVPDGLSQQAMDGVVLMIKGAIIKPVDPAEAVKSKIPAPK